MSKDDWVYLGHMLDMGQKALDLIVGLNKFDYDEDETLKLALTHLVQVIGEAARRVSPVFQEAHPEIPWHEIIGMRHRVVHDYLNVDEDIIWEVVHQDLPALVEALIKSMPPEER
jgi:uncharacterized protein with HEPN domain